MIILIHSLIIHHTSWFAPILCTIILLHFPKNSRKFLNFSVSLFKIISNNIWIPRKYVHANCIYLSDKYTANLISKAVWVYFLFFFHCNAETELCAKYSMAKIYGILICFICHHLYDWYCSGLFLFWFQTCLCERIVVFWCDLYAPLIEIIYITYFRLWAYGIYVRLIVCGR